MKSTKTRTEGGKRGEFTAGSMWRRLFAILVFAASLSHLAGAASNPQGKITGRISDAETGEALIGVTVMLEGTMIGARTDLNGVFLIKKVPLGAGSRCRHSRFHLLVP